MSSEIVVPVIIYLALFRLAIIAAGIVSIVLGYRLFCRGVWPGNGSGTAVDAEIAGQRFSLKNAAPGTCFALFGVLTISVMFVSGPPELSQQFAASQDGKTNGGGEFRLRGPGTTAPSTRNALQTRLKEAAQAYRGGDFSRADAIYEEIHIDLEPTRDHLALLNNEWAVRYLEASKFDQAVKKASVAVMLAPEDDDYIDTYVTAICKAQNPAEARRHLSDLASTLR